MTLEMLVQDVTAWHLEEFGREPIDWLLAKKLVEEADEFRACIATMACATYQYERDYALADASAEAADCLIVLCAWAGRNGVDLLAEAQKKLAIVKGRNQRQRDVDRGILPAEVSA